MKQTNGGWFINHENIEETYKLILDISNNEREYLSIQKNVEDIKFKTISEMSDEYLKIYEKLL